MRTPLAQACGIGLVIAIIAATLFDLAIAAGHVFKPWLGWMLP